MSFFCWAAFWGLIERFFFFGSSGDDVTQSVESFREFSCLGFPLPQALYFFADDGPSRRAASYHRPSFWLTESA